MKARRVFSVAAIALSLCLLAGLCGCSGEAGTPAEPTGIEFQGIPWNSGPEEVCEALGLDMDTLEREEDNYSVTLTARDVEAFGTAATLAQFRFFNFSLEEGGYCGLDQIHIVFPESADKEAVLAALTEAFGPEAQEYTQYDYITGRPRTYAKEEGISRWFSPTKLGDVLSEEERPAFRDLYLMGLSDEDLASLMESEPVSIATWTEDYYGQIEAEHGSTPALEAAVEEYGRVATLDLNGEHMARVLQMF